MAEVETGKFAATDSISKGLVDLGRRHAFYVNERGERFNLVALHRMNMHYLRIRLLNEAATIFRNGTMKDEDSKALTSLIQDYCIAIRDREFMRESALRDWDKNPFHLKSQRETERDLLEDLKAKGIHPNQMVSVEEARVLPHLPGGPWDSLRTRRERYVLAILGGLILTVPMILMVLARRTPVSMITVSVCTMLFAVVTAYFSPTKLPLELLSATAAYAAVLVVFVGGTTGSGP